ncbi:Ribonuclease H [Abeliophyllum distichum]|uniref:Ribonuclease H n=1 Tax=Abeliophyllum distichum TaxID=126358 RepID=A0ABD1V9P5_9LAMI
MAPGSSTGAYNYGVAIPTYYETGTGSLPILPPRQETPSKYCLLHRSHGHSTEECREVENLANRRETNSGPRRGASTRRQLTKIRHGGILEARVGSHAVERQTENRFIKGPEKPPIREIDTIYGGTLHRGPVSECPEKLRERSRGEIGNKLAYKQSTLELKQGPVVARNGLGRMLVDNGSSVNVIFSSTYEQMNIDVPLEPSTEPLYGFTGDCVTPKGIIRLAVTMGEEPLAAHTFMEIFSGRQEVSLSRSFRPTRPKRTLGCNFHPSSLNALRKAEKKEVNMTFCDVIMEEASEAASEDVEMEEASLAEDIDPRITGIDSQTSDRGAGKLPRRS